MFYFFGPRGLAPHVERGVVLFRRSLIRRLSNARFLSGQQGRRGRGMRREEGGGTTGEEEGQQGRRWEG